MGNLRPIGSEKLQGEDKIKRIIEISMYNDKSSSVNENKTNEYSIEMSDGVTYEIVKEKSGYIIKERIDESTSEYIAPMKNRKYYPSYSQAFKRLNLMAKEINTLVENTEGISLFNEDKKFILKRKEKMDEMDMNTEELDEQVPAAPAPAPAAPSPAPVSAAPAPAPESEPTPSPEPEPMPEPEEDMDQEQDDEEMSFKSIQKLTGKLAQKLRTFGQGEEEMTSNDVKYVINSILSALDLSILEEDDVDEILSRFEGEEEMGQEDEFDNEDEFESEEEELETEPSPEGEMAETMSMGDALTKKIPSIYAGNIKKELNTEMEDEFEDESNFRHRGARKHHFSHGTFNESKIDNIIKQYFVIDEKEKSIMEEKEKKQIILTENRLKKIKSEIKRLSESIRQERSAVKFLQTNTSAKLIGSTNKGNLVFECENKEYKISPKGEII
jgi:hypothetical protein